MILGHISSWNGFREKIIRIPGCSGIQAGYVVAVPLLAMSDLFKAFSLQSVSAVFRPTGSSEVVMEPKIKHENSPHQQ